MPEESSVHFKRLTDKDPSMWLIGHVQDMNDVDHSDIAHHINCQDYDTKYHRSLCA